MTTLEDIKLIAVKRAEKILKSKGPMVANNLSKMLREDYQLDLTSREISYAIKLYSDNIKKTQLDGKVYTYYWDDKRVKK